MADRHEQPMATPGEIAIHHRPLVGREAEVIEGRIRRMTLKEIIAGFFQLKAAQLAGFLSRRVEAKPVPWILIALGLGLVTGELLRRAAFPRRR